MTTPVDFPAVDMLAFGPTAPFAGGGRTPRTRTVAELGPDVSREGDSRCVEAESEDVEGSELHGDAWPGVGHLRYGVLPGALARATHDD